jgi:integrase
MLSKDIARYIELHQAMGFKFRTQSLLLRNFMRFAEHRKDDYIHTSRVLEWAALAPSPPQRRNRLATIRRCALAMHAEDARHEVPPAGAFGRGWFKRRKPFIYSPEQVAMLVWAASQLKPNNSIRPATYSTLFALLAATGLRISEALTLEVQDITDDGLLVRATKFKKDRLVPVHPSTRQALERYLRYRAHVPTTSASVFISMKGTALCYSTVVTTFLSLMRSLGLREKPGGPRIHDLRHTFAVRSLENCAGDAEAVLRHATALSTYLGHAHISDTYWYLQATPLLMEQIAQAGESLYRGDAP